MKSNNNLTKYIVILFFLTASAIFGQEINFKEKPKVTKIGDAYKITFALSKASDVEVAIIDSTEQVVKHLASGVLEGKFPPPPPLKPGLIQEISWDGKDDFGKPCSKGPFKCRVRVGFTPKFNSLFGADPYNFGAIDGIVADEEGNIYISGSKAVGNQMASCIRVFDSEGNYLREILPFPTTVAPDGMKEIARWDEERKTFLPRNLRNLNPDFYGQAGGYWANSSLQMLKASKDGLVLTDGHRLLQLDANGAVKGSSFVTRNLGGVKNSGGGPTFVTISPDNKWVYISGPYSNTNSYGYVFDPNFPPGRVYRAPFTGNDVLQPFVSIEVNHKDGNGGEWVKACTNMGHFVSPKGAVHQTAVDKKGNVYVADREHGCVIVYDDSIKEIGKINIKNPHLISIHPNTGAIYITQYDCFNYGEFQCVLNKFENFNNPSAPVAKYDFPRGNYANMTQNMALCVKGDKTCIWMTGVKGGLVVLEDKNNTFEVIKNKFIQTNVMPQQWIRIATDYSRDEVYISDGAAGLWRFNGATGEGERLKKDGKPFEGTDLAVGYDGLLYVRTGGGYSGPFERLNRDLTPAVYPETGTHVLSKYIYSRMGNGFAERGLGVGPDGKAYISFMYTWVAYAIGCIGGDGKPVNGKFLEGKFPALKEPVKAGYPEGWNKAIIGPLPAGCANIRVDFQGNIYVGMNYRPAGFVTPKAFEKDQGYRVSVGSVVKFSPEGGSMPGPEGAASATQIEGAITTYTGLAPFSSSAEAFGSNTCCVCRVPRFDLDRFGRLALPNSMTNSVLIYDNAGNLICEFGKYGNFDSQYIKPGESKPSIATPDIPLGWPVGAGFTEKFIYVIDSYCRRGVRVEQTYSLNEVVEFK